MSIPILRTIAASLMLASSAFAQTCTLLDAAFDSRDVKVESFDAAGVTLDDRSVVPLDDLVELRWTSTAKPSAAAVAKAKTGLVLLLADGQRIAGRAEGIDGETLRWVGVAGSIAVDLKHVRRVAPMQALLLPFEPTVDDVVKLKNGDALHGVLNGGDAKQLFVRPAGAEEDTKIDWSAVASVQLAGDAPTPPSLKDGPVFRVTLNDGTVLLGRSLAMKKGDKLWQLEDLTSAKRSLAAGAVSQVERLGGRVAWLSTLAPTEVIDRPFFPSATARVPLFDRAAAREPVAVAGKPVERSLSVRSCSRITFAVPQGFRQLRFRYALPDDAKAGNVTVRVFTAERIAFERTNVVAGSLSDAVMLPLDGATSVALEVDYGENYDVQDQLEWIDAALVR